MLFLLEAGFFLLFKPSVSTAAGGPGQNSTTRVMRGQGRNLATPCGCGSAGIFACPQTAALWSFWPTTAPTSAQWWPSVSAARAVAQPGAAGGFRRRGGRGARQGIKIVTQYKLVTSSSQFTTVEQPISVPGISLELLPRSRKSAPVITDRIYAT